MEKIEMKILGKYHDFYGQSNTLLLANESFNKRQLFISYEVFNTTV